MRESRCHRKVTGTGHLGVRVSAHSIELLHPTDPPGPRALRVVILLLVAAILVGAAVWATDPGRSPALEDAAQNGSNARNP